MKKLGSVGAKDIIYYVVDELPRVLLALVTVALRTCVVQPIAKILVHGEYAHFVCGFEP